MRACIRTQLPTDGSIVEVQFENERQAEEFVAQIQRGEFLAWRVRSDGDAGEMIVSGR